MTVTIEYGSRRIAVTPSQDSGGSSACFLGRGGSGEHSVAIRLTSDDRTMPRRAVSISCPFEGVWQIRRVSDRVGVEVRFDDGSRLIIPSDRWRLMPADEDRAYVVVATPARSYEFSVRLGQHAPVLAETEPGEDTKTLIALRSDPDVGYFRVCIALCESRLLDPFIDEVPTESEIADRLIATGLEVEISRKSVQRRLESVRSRLGVATNRELRERLVASRAVLPEHLALLKSAD